MQLVGEGSAMKVDESSLTGESLAISKRPGDSALAGAVVAEGELDAVVTATGRDCFFRKTMALLHAPQETGHLQKVSLPTHLKHSHSIYLWLKRSSQLTPLSIKLAGNKAVHPTASSPTHFRFPNKT